MEFVRVAYPSERFVYIDGQKGGRTNEVLRIDAGSHRFDLGVPVNYQPVSQEVEVQGTTVLTSRVVVFVEAWE